MKPNPLFPTTSTLGINTDLYELTMAAAYFQAGAAGQRATFELFARRLPENRAFLMATGLEQALHYILNAGFSEAAIDYLRNLPNFADVDRCFFDYLRGFRFTGDVWAVPEGTVVFAEEPLLQVSAPIIEAQVLETFLINTLNFQTMIASKAGRICAAAGEKSVVDFGSRRAHTPQAGVAAARAAFIGGCDGTSNVLAGFEMGIPVVGTMAHSFIQFFDDEPEAFARYQAAFPKHTIFLVDTYDTLKGVEHALELGGIIRGIRLDSGNLAELAIEARKLLDQAGRQEVRIYARGDLDEVKIPRLELAGAPIDAYGAGTELVVSGDAPSLETVYKLVEVFEDGEARPRMKTSTGKMTTPFRKQIFRCAGAGGFQGDTLAAWDEPGPGCPNGLSTGLLEQYVASGRLCRDLPEVGAIKDYARAQVAQLPAPYKRLHAAQEYPVKFSDLLVAAREEFIRSRSEGT